MSSSGEVAGDSVPLILESSDPGAEQRAAEILRSGGLVSFPTDTVYALAASLAQPSALEAIYDAKGRSLTKAIPILLSSSVEVDQVALPIPARLSRFLSMLWPGQLTVVLPARSGLPAHVTVPSANGGRTVAVRVPDHHLARSLIEQAGGALAATSANRSGHSPATTAAAAVAQLCSSLDAVIDGGPAPGGVASTIISLTASGFEILRQGGLSAAELERRWRETGTG